VFRFFAHCWCCFGPAKGTSVLAGSLLIAGVVLHPLVLQRVFLLGQALWLLLLVWRQHPLILLLAHLWVQDLQELFVL
jgi:hypothetical protein